MELSDSQSEALIKVIFSFWFSFSMHKRNFSQLRAAASTISDGPDFTDQYLLRFLRARAFKVGLYFWCGYNLFKSFIDHRSWGTAPKCCKMEVGNRSVRFAWDSWEIRGTDPFICKPSDLVADILFQVLRDYFTGGLCGTSVDGHPIAIERTYSPDFQLFLI